MPTAEQELYRAYSQLMNPRQRRAFLALSTTEEREAFAKETGIAQRFEALLPEERQAALYGQPFIRYEWEGLRFVWGEPCWQQGPVEHQTWLYYGPIFSLAAPGWNCPSSYDLYTEVKLVDRKVQWWIERVPTPGNLRRSRR